MRQADLVGVLFILSLTAGCIAVPAAGDGEPGSSQQELIASWHRCVNTNLARLRAEGLGPATSIDNTLVACQGHQEDVLATFPDHLHRPLQNLMQEQAWESGYAAWSPEVREVAQSATRLLR